MEKICSDCRNNPTAKRPYTKLHYIRMTDLTRKLVSEMTKKTNSNVNGVVCQIIRDFTKEARKDGND